MGECIFCDIVAGTAPAEVLYEDESAVAFLDIAQATEGHTLVVPREHCVDLFDIGEDRAAEVMRTAVRVADILKAALGAEGMNLINASGRIAWQQVFHFHLHLVPRYAIDELALPWQPGEGVPPERLSNLAERVRAAGLG
jgi:histidine triad (HIT) family protein